MLTTEIIARLVLKTSPNLAGEVWSSWAEEACALHGEDCEVAAMLRPLILHDVVDADDLEPLGATEHQLTLASVGSHDARESRQVARVVLRRHAQPGSVGGLSEEGLLASRSLAALRSFDDVRCGPSARTRRTAEAWMGSPITDLCFALPPDRAERVVGAHAPFSAWRSPHDAAVREYGHALADAHWGLSTVGRSVMVITHDGAPQALLAAVGASLPPWWRDDSLGFLEGVSVERDEDGVVVVERLGAPPIALLGRGVGVAQAGVEPD